MAVVVVVVVADAEEEAEEAVAAAAAAEEAEAYEEEVEEAVDEVGWRRLSVGTMSKAQMKRERRRQRHKEHQAARGEVAVLLDELGLSEHLTLCLDNEMDVGASAGGCNPWSSFHRHL